MVSFPVGLTEQAQNLMTVLHARMAGLVTNLDTYNLVSKAVFQPCLIQSQIHSLLHPKVRVIFTMRYSLETSFHKFLIPGSNGLCPPL